MSNDARRIKSWVGYGDPQTMQVFCAALQGFIANKDFHGPVSQGHPRPAIEFANEVALEFFTQRNLNR